MLAARTLFAGEQSVNREFFSLATQRSGELALTNWRCCLEAGDSMAHFALGYTLYDLGRFHETYRHLRYYAQIAPASAWNWCWLGKAAQAIGEVGEARAAYERACEVEVAMVTTVRRPMRRSYWWGWIGVEGGSVGESISYRSKPIAHHLA